MDTPGVAPEPPGLAPDSAGVAPDSPKLTPDIPGVAPEPPGDCLFWDPSVCVGGVPSRQSRCAGWYFHLHTPVQRLRRIVWSACPEKWSWWVRVGQFVPMTSAAAVPWRPSDAAADNAAHKIFLKTSEIWKMATTADVGNHRAKGSIETLSRLSRRHKKYKENLPTAGGWRAPGPSPAHGGASALTAPELTNSPNWDFGVWKNGGNGGKWGEMGKMWGEWGNRGHSTCAQPPSLSSVAGALCRGCVPKIGPVHQIPG